MKRVNDVVNDGERKRNERKQITLTVFLVLGNGVKNCLLLFLFFFQEKDDGVGG